MVDENHCAIENLYRYSAGFKYYFKLTGKPKFIYEYGNPVGSFERKVFLSKNLYRLSSFRGVEQLMRRYSKWVFLDLEIRDSRYSKKLESYMTFNEAAFDREYESKWTGTSEGAFFDGENFDRCRTIRQPDISANDLGSTKSAFYVISADIGRKGDLTAVSVIKAVPQTSGVLQKQLVNLYS